MKGIFWHSGTNRWASSIGKKHSKKGDRVAAVWYFTGAPGEPSAEVVADVVVKRREWAKIKAEWPTLKAKLSENKPDLDWSKPVWYDPADLEDPANFVGEGDDPDVLKLELADAAHARTGMAVEDLALAARSPNASAGTIAEQLRAAGIIRKEMMIPIRTLSVREAMDEYLDGQKARVSLKAGKRIDVGSYNGTRRNLMLSLGLSCGKGDRAMRIKAASPLIDLDKPIVNVGRKDLEQVAAHWHMLPVSVRGTEMSRRTVQNYLAGLRWFLSWCSEQEDLGFSYPKAYDKVLQMNGSVEPNVTPVNYTVLAEIFKTASERTRMYGLIGLLAGFYQADISKLMSSEVQEVKGELYVTGYRSKEDSESKATVKIRTTHCMPKEVADLMRRHKAEPNQWGVYFLNKASRPMRSETIDGGKIDAVADAWSHATKDVDGAPSFKQLRKWGWNEIQRFGDPKDQVCIRETLAHRWAGQQGGRVAQSYRREDYEPVIAAQRRWWKAIKGKVLPKASKA